MPAGRPRGSRHIPAPSPASGAPWRSTGRPPGHPRSSACSAARRCAAAGRHGERRRGPAEGRPGRSPAISGSRALARAGPPSISRTRRGGPASRPPQFSALRGGRGGLFPPRPLWYFASLRERARMPPYECHVFVCTHGEYCPFDGYAEVHRLLKEGVAARGLKGRVRVNKAGCFNQCGNGPMVVVYPENVWYGGVTPDKALRILEEHIAGGRPVEDLRYEGPPGPNKNAVRMAAINAARSALKPTGSGTD